MEHSEGHLAFVGDAEYFTIGDCVYRAPKRNPLDIHGHRQGARFECPVRMSTQMLKLALEAARD